MKWHHKPQGGEANIENNNTIYSKRTVSAKLKTNRQTKKNEELMVLADRLGLPRGREWEITPELCMMPITSYRNFSQKIKIKPPLKSNPQEMSTFSCACRNNLWSRHWKIPKLVITASWPPSRYC